MGAAESQFPRRERLQSTWMLARLSSAGAVPAPDDWFDALVPGAVQLDWARAKGIPDFAYGKNVSAYSGLEDSHWLYRTQVPDARLEPGRALFFFCGGVDFECEVRLAGAVVHRARGMLTGFDIDVSLAPAGTPLEILLMPAPKRPGVPEDRCQASHVTKPAVSYGWDWHPRLIPLGLCEETGFEVRPSSHLAHVDFAYQLSEDLCAAEITVSASVRGPAAPLLWRLRDPSGNAVIETTGPRARLENPDLWWTHDHGRQALYTLEAELGTGDVLIRSVGFRRVRLVMHEGAWDGEVVFPKSRERPPVTVELNGRRVFIKGTNWVNPDVFHGRVDAETYRPLIAHARGANLNLIRCWGGAPAAKEAFFDQCDQVGILVWQEFPLACNLYPDDGAYLALLEGEARSLVRRVRQHPCLALWVGGNELFNSWSRMTDQALPLRLLNKVCYEEDRSTAFLPTAPVEGMGHGDYRFWNSGRDVFELFQSSSNTAYSEFGCPSTSPVEYLSTFIPKEELWPPRPGTSWTVHHGLGAWEADATTWLCTNTLRHFFGEPGSLDEVVRLSNWLQCEGYRSIFEEARRQKPRCSMALNWCFNEPWPTAANNSLLNWPARPKPALAAVREACRPVLASARIPRFQWRPGEHFSAELWVLNDRPVPVPPGILRASLVSGGARLALAEWPFGEIPAGENRRGPEIRAVLPAAPGGEFHLELSIDGRPECASGYRLSLVPSAAAGPASAT